MTTSVMWFRRDLRLADNPALRAAVDAGPDGVVPLFVLDARLWDPAGPSRRHHLVASLGSLSERVGGLELVTGDPVEQVVAVAQAVGATTVHVAADFGPYGRERDAAVEKALAEADVELVRTGSAYAVAPGRVTKGDGTPYAVFTPFYRAWLDHGWRQPPASPHAPPWLRVADGEDVARTDLPDVELPDGLELPPAGEETARRHWRRWLDAHVGAYDDTRDLMGDDVTSRMSVHLKWGEIHPRTMLADLAGAADRDHDPGATAYRRELGFREFYADVLWHQPHTATDYLKPEFARMDYDEPGEALAAWQEGRTGFPVVDAAMRQLRATGWMHNRARMIVASFLVKDLHLEWQHGARHFQHWLVDGDVASNSHGWQWTAGCGTDASPYFRIFNPVTQAKKFDPDGTYVKRWVPELADVDRAHVHEPWTAPDGVPAGYPEPIVDHKAERVESLRRYDAVKA